MVLEQKSGPGLQRRGPCRGDDGDGGEGKQSSGRGHVCGVESEQKCVLLSVLSVGRRAGPRWSPRLHPADPNHSTGYLRTKSPG